MAGNKKKSFRQFINNIIKSTRNFFLNVKNLFKKSNILSKIKLREFVFFSEMPKVFFIIEKITIIILQLSSKNDKTSKISKKLHTSAEDNNIKSGIFISEKN